MKLLIAFLLLTQISFGQTGYGTIIGTIKYDNGEPAPFVKILVTESNDPDGKIVAGCQSDFDGKFQLNTLTPGEYNITFTSSESDALKLDGVIVTVDRITFIEPVRMNYIEFEYDFDVPMQPIRQFDDFFGRYKTIETEDIRRL